MSACRHSPLSLPRRAVVPDYGAGGLFGLVGAIGHFLDGKPWRMPGEDRRSDEDRCGDGRGGDSASPLLVFLLAMLTGLAPVEHG